MPKFAPHLAPVRRSILAQEPIVVLRTLRVSAAAGNELAELSRGIW
jgi:hypothetical protein